MKERSIKNKLLIAATVAILCSTSFFMMYDAESSDAAPPTITLTDGSIGFAPKFTVSPWRVNEYNSINYVYTTTFGGSGVIGFGSSWVSVNPGIKISAYGSSVQPGNNLINWVSNGNGTYSYYFKLSGTPTTAGEFDVRNQIIVSPPIQIPDGMCFNFTIVDDFFGATPSSAKRSNSIDNGSHKVSASSAIELKGVSWKPGEERWNFEYRMAGIGHTEGLGYRILNAFMILKTTENTSNIILWPSPADSRYIGSTPASSTGTDYSGVANTVISLALSVNPWAGAVWGVASIVAALASLVNYNTETSGYVQKQWTWFPSINDTAQFYWFNVVVEPDQIVEFSYEYIIMGGTYELLSTGKGYRTLYGGPTNNNGLSNPTQMTVAERKQCGIETITRENLLTRAAELNISETILNEWLESDEGVFYYAHNVVEYETPQPEKVELNKSTLTRDLLFKELSEQIERSERIIEGFSSNEIGSMDESIAIVEKHTVRLASLLELQDLLKVVPEKNQMGLNKIFDSYCRNIVETDPVYSGRVRL